MVDKAEALWSALRIVLGWLFLWPFLDKLLGLGFATSPDRAWIAGGSPTAGFLSGVDGPVASVFNAMSGMPAIDFLFMGALLFVGVTFLLDVWRRWGSYVGAILMFMIFLSVQPLANNPVIDDHIIYILSLLALGAVSDKGRMLSLGKALGR